MYQPRLRTGGGGGVSERGLVTFTVLLELASVMRGFCGLPRAEIARVLRALLGIGHVAVVDRRAVIDALDLVEAGVGFASAERA